MDLCGADYQMCVGCTREITHDRAVLLLTEILAYHNPISVLY